MTIVDIGIAIGIGLFVFSGFFEGFIKKIFGLLVLIVAFYTALHTHHFISEWLQVSFSWPRLFSTILAFLCIFLFLLISGNILYRVFGNKNELYKSWDRLGGGLFGFIEGAILVSLVLHLISLIDFPSEEIINQSLLYSTVYSFAPVVFETLYIFIPQVREFFEIFIRDIEINNTPT